MAETKRVINFDPLSNNNPTNGDYIFVDNASTGSHKFDLKTFVDLINNGFDSAVKSSGVNVNADNYSTIITNVNDQPVNTIYTYGSGLQSNITNLPSNRALTIMTFAQKSTGGLGQVMIAVERNGSGDDSIYFRTIGGSPAVWSSWVKVANNSDVEAVREALDNLDIETDATLSISGKPADAKAAGDEINDLKADLIKRNIPTTSAIPNCTVNSQNGKVTEYSIYSYVEFSVFPGDVITYKTGHNETAAGLAFYNRNGIFINVGYAATNGTQTITVPINAYIVKACYRTAEENIFKIDICDSIVSIIGKLNNAEYTADSLEKVLATNRYLSTTVWDHGSISSYGTETGNNYYARSGFIKVLPNIVKYVRATLNQGTYSSNLNCYIYIYNTPSDYVGNIPIAIGTTDITDSISAGQYIRCVIRDGTTTINLADVSGILSVEYNTVNTDKTLSKPNYAADAEVVGNVVKRIDGIDYNYVMTKILCMGDSLTIGSSPTEDWGVTTDTVHIGQSYPAMLARINNCPVINGGHSGATAQSWYSSYRNNYNYSDFDTYILWFGTNAGMTADSIDTSGSQANYYCKIIDKILADYATGHTDPDYGQYPQIILLKCFAVASGTGTVIDTNMAIDAIATKYQSYGVAVIDMSDLGYADHPELHENVDNPHFGKVGYLYIADRIAKRMREWYAESPTRADFAQTPESFIYPSETTYVTVKEKTVEGVTTYTANKSIAEILDNYNHGVNIKVKKSNDVYEMTYAKTTTSQFNFSRVNYVSNTIVYQSFDFSIVEGVDVISYIDSRN